MLYISKYLKNPGKCINESIFQHLLVPLASFVIGNIEIMKQYVTSNGG
jgi:hypothetical protein